MTSDTLTRAAKSAGPRRFTGEPITAFADLAPIPTPAEFIARVDAASGTRWEGDNLVRFAPELSDAEIEALNEAADRATEEENERNEDLRWADDDRPTGGVGSGPWGTR